jgi:hypothetical protein
MKINKRILFGILNLMLSGLTLVYFIIELLLNLDHGDKLNGALYFWPFEVSGVLSLLSGIMLLSGKRWVWALVGIISIAACWRWHLIMLSHIRPA